MKSERVTPKWEPSAAELDAAARLMCAVGEPDPMQRDFDHLMGSTQEYWFSQGKDVLKCLGPRIAARSLREAASDWEAKGYERGQAAGRWFRARAADLEAK